MTSPASLSCPSDPCPEAIDDLDCCPICLEGYAQQHKVLVTPCSHRYHEYCITKWLKTKSIWERTCVLCRSIAVPLVRESSSVFDDDNETNPFIESPILRSVRLGQRDFIAPLLVSNPSLANQPFLSAVSGKKVSLLHIAAQEGHRELAADLLTAGALVNALLSNGATPLFIAALRGQRELAADLLKAGAEVSKARKDRATPLHIAAQKGYRGLAADLLKAGALVNASRNDGATPLFMAAQNGHLGLVADLLVAGADPEKKCRIFGPLIKKSAIQAARKSHHDDIVQMLTDWRCSMKRIRHDQTEVDLTRREPQSHGDTQFFQACPDYYTVSMRLTGFRYHKPPHSVRPER